MPHDNKNLDAGLALVLGLLIAFLFSQRIVLVTAAIVLLVLCMTAPVLFSPFARVWFPASELLGRGVSQVLLVLVFFLLLVPVGVARRLAGKDPMRLSAWRSGSDSLFTSRNHRFVPDDLERPF